MRGVLLSLIFHGLVVGAGFVYLPRAARVLEETHIVPVELVTLSDTTNIRAASPEPVEEEIEPDEEIPLEQEISDPEPPAPDPEPAPAEPEALPVEDEAPTEPDPEEDAEPETAPEPDPPTPTPTPRPRRETPDPPRRDSFDDLLDRAAEATSRARATEEGEERAAVGDGEEMTAELRDIIASQIATCWRLPADMPYPEERAVMVILELGRDGNLRNPPRIDEAATRDRNDRFRQAARESALRAAVQCAPYRLPAEQYSRWRRFTANFDPSPSGR